MTQLLTFFGLKPNYKPSWAEAQLQTSWAEAQLQTSWAKAQLRTFLG